MFLLFHGDLEMKRKKLSAVIVTYNSAEDILGCLKSIYSEDKDVQIIVVDNSSMDNTIELVKIKFPQVVIIPMGGNLGYAAGVNCGIAESSGEFILIINPDCRILTGTLSAMRKTIALPEAGAVGPMLMDENGIIDPNASRQDLSWHIILFTVLGIDSKKFNFTIFRRYYYRGQTVDKEWQVKLLSGACMMIKREVVRDVGGMDTGFFLFGEDVDFSLRIGRCGYKLFYQPKARVIHHTGKSRRSNVGQVMAEEIWSMSRLAAKLGFSVTSKLALFLAIFLLPLRVLWVQLVRKGSGSLRFQRASEILKYIFYKIRKQGWPWANISQENYIPLKDSG